MQSNPPPIMCSKTLKHSLCNLEPKLAQEKADKHKGRKEVAPILFLNPDLVVQLVGCANEAPVVMDGCKVTALVDLGVHRCQPSVKGSVKS